jgi:hypothetical protein
MQHCYVRCIENSSFSCLCSIAKLSAIIGDRKISRVVAAVHGNIIADSDEFGPQMCSRCEMRAGNKGCTIFSMFALMNRRCVHTLLPGLLFSGWCADAIASNSACCIHLLVQIQ